MDDHHYIGLAIEEAKKGVGRTAPNPAVGAVIVKNDRVIGRGYHKKAGTPHAEIHAINNCTESPVGATIYVTLEPCSHTGKTGPCCEAIFQAGFRRVVMGMTDPNPIVNGRGVSYLRSKGVEVVTEVRNEECEALNLPFIKFISTSLPFMVMKAGVSLDGKLNYQPGVTGKITGAESKVRVHQLRDRYDAILVGSKTVLADNPSLTTRLQTRGHRDPVRIVIDRTLSTPLTSKVFTQESEAKTIVLTSVDAAPQRKRAFEEKGVTLFTLGEKGDTLDLVKGLSAIAAEGISSVLVEGGSKIHGSLLKERLYDYAHLFYAPVFAGSSGQALTSSVDVSGREDAPRIVRPEYEILGEDIMVSGKIMYPESGQERLP